MTALSAARELRSFLRRNGSRSPGAATAALDGLHAVVPSECSALSVWDPVARHHRSLASSYPPVATTFLDALMHTDPVFTFVQAGRTLVRIRDLAPPLRNGRTFEQVITPLGFREGFTQCLFATDGRYVGMLNASSLDVDHAGDDTVALLELLAPDLGAALDPVPAPRPATARLADGELDGFVVGPGGAITPLSPGARPDLLTPPSPLHAAVAQVRAGLPPSAPVLHVVLNDSVVAVELHPSPPAVVVLHRETPPPAGLTQRELHVLADVAEGLSNGEIAAAHCVSSRTVATHVEHILAKTGCRNRIEAARLASRWGLLVTPNR
ncbi:response regulator transcription factor [Amycolatopsis sp. CA-161197]|uniref:helix-turn-helix transcriptional regulator n=1 Tax=Amycolatopsis sp. CA-161197 TaxID=3239922 RepID=UPI003D8DB75E